MANEQAYLPRQGSPAVLPLWWECFGSHWELQSLESITAICGEGVGPHSLPSRGQSLLQCPFILHRGHSCFGGLWTFLTPVVWASISWCVFSGVSKVPWGGINTSINCSQKSGLSFFIFPVSVVKDVATNSLAFSRICAFSLRCNNGSELLSQVRENVRPSLMNLL